MVLVDDEDVAVFERAVKKAGGSGVFLEYFFDIGSCDPCSAPPPSVGQMLELGVWWADGDNTFDADELTFETIWSDSGSVACSSIAIAK